MAEGRGTGRFFIYRDKLIERETKTKKNAKNESDEKLATWAFTPLHLHVGRRDDGGLRPGYETEERERERETGEKAENEESTQPWASFFLSFSSLFPRRRVEERTLPASFTWFDLICKY